MVPAHHVVHLTRRDLLPPRVSGHSVQENSLISHHEVEFPVTREMDQALTLAHPSSRSVHLPSFCTCPESTSQCQASIRLNCLTCATSREWLRPATILTRLPCIQGTVQGLEQSPQPLLTSIQGE